MTIRRQYSLPNCTLILEGLSDATPSTALLDARPILSILMSAECQFAGHAQPLTGGRDFFDSLVRVVSSYAQEFLSGVPSPASLNDPLSLVKLHRINENLHRLIVESPDTGHRFGPTDKPKLPIQLDLTTVQLFDLVEAMDQFFADSRTLPDLSLQLAPVPRRYAKSTEPVAKRALPMAVGVSSLALAAMAFFLVPVPDVQRPKDPAPQPNASSGNLATPTPNGSGTPNPNGTPPVNPTPATTPSPDGTATGANSTPSPNASPTASVSPTATPSPTASPISAEDLKASQTTAVKITDSAEVEQLKAKLFEQIDQAWKNTPALEKPLTYRVSVGKDGAVVGYKPVSPESADDRQTPLPNLLYKPVGSRPLGEPLADFRVVFTPSGALQVSPW